MKKMKETGQASLTRAPVLVLVISREGGSTGNIRPGISPV